MKLILVRHGETIENRLHILQGQTHGKLTEQGIRQTNRLADFLASFEINVCYTSDLRRALDTACIIVSRHPRTKIIQDTRLRERYLGDLQGGTIPNNWHGYNYHKTAEPMPEMYARIKSFICHLQSNHQDETVLIISHGITLKIFISTCLQHDDLQHKEMGELDNCSVIILEKKSKHLPFELYNTPKKFNSNKQTKYRDTRFPSN